MIILFYSFRPNCEPRVRNVRTSFVVLWCYECSILSDFVRGFRFRFARKFLTLASLSVPTLTPLYKTISNLAKNTSRVLATLKTGDFVRRQLGLYAKHNELTRRGLFLVM